MQVFHNHLALSPQQLRLKRILIVVHRPQRLVDADVAERHGSPAVFEDRRDRIVSLQPDAVGAFHVEDRGDLRLHIVHAVNSDHQRAEADLKLIIEEAPELQPVPLREDCDARQVDADDAEVAPAISLLNAVGVDPLRQEGAASHRVLERACDLHDLLVVEDVGVHALRGTLQRELLDIVVRIAGLAVDAVLDGEDKLWEDRGAVVDAEAADAVLKHCLLYPARVLAGAEAKSQSYERSLAVRRVERVDLVLKSLECVVALLLCRFVGELLLALTLRGDGGDVPEMLLPAGLDVGLKDAVNAVDRTAAILMAGNLRDYLRGDGAGGRDALRCRYLRVAHPEAVGEHVAEGDEAAVHLRKQRRVVKVMEMDKSALVVFRDAPAEFLVRLLVVEKPALTGDDARRHVAHRRDRLRVLVGVLMEHVDVVAPDDETVELLVDGSALLTGDIPVMAVLNVGAGDGGTALHQAVLNRPLHLLDRDGVAVNLCYIACGVNRHKGLEGAPGVFVPDCLLRPADCRPDAYRVKLRDAPVALYNLLHAPLPPCRS